MNFESKKINYLKLFGESLRRYRIDQGLSQETLAEKARIDRSYLGAIERGQHNLTLTNIIKLADALGINPHDLLIVYQDLKINDPDTI